MFSGSSVVCDENYHQHELWAGLSWILRLSELLFKNDWRGNTHRGVQISWMLSSSSCQLLYLHPRKALWLPSRLIVLGLPVGRIERTPSKKEQQTSIQKSIQTSWLYSWLSELKHRVPGAARWKLNKSVRIFRYSTWQMISQYPKLRIFWWLS